MSCRTWVKGWDTYAYTGCRSIRGRDDRNGAVQTRTIPHLNSIRTSQFSRLRIQSRRPPFRVQTHTPQNCLSFIAAFARVPDTPRSFRRRFRGRREREGGSRGRGGAYISRQDIKITILKLYDAAPALLINIVRGVEAGRNYVFVNALLFAAIWPLNYSIELSFGVTP